MPRITIDLLRKRSEHNEGIISTLEEISLHQEELEKIEVIGTHCRKLRILYLQNNIIEKMEDLTHMKDLRYLNLALNNISKIEGLDACEFLDKLDLTVNFVDFDTLEESINHLKPRQHLRELYMLGNPSQANWPDDGFREYVVASLPQLELLDGKEIHRSDRIRALQVFPQRLRFLRDQAERIMATSQATTASTPIADDNKEGEMTSASNQGADVIEINEDGQATDISQTLAVEPALKKTSILKSQEKVPYTPDTRRAMYMELAEQKEEEDARRRENQPRERDPEREHKEALQKMRHQEAHSKSVSQSGGDAGGEDRIRQCNQGKWDFRLLDEDLDVVLEVDLPRFLDTSLVDMDVHPSYVSIVIKNKLLRLRFPELVHSDRGRAERSKITGTLRLTVPKANVSAAQQERAQRKREDRERHEKERLASTEAKRGSCSARTRRMKVDGTKLSEEVMQAAQPMRGTSGTPAKGGTVKRSDIFRNLIRKKNSEAGGDENHDSNQISPKRDSHLTPVRTMKKSTRHRLATHSEHPQEPSSDEDDTPPLIY